MNTISPERLDSLQRSWVNLLASFSISPAAAYPVFDRLVEAYSKPHRHYHTLEHVAEVLRVAGRLSADRNVLLAVWFHDVVYDPKDKQNERASGDWAVMELFHVGVPWDTTERVVELIDSTAHFDAVDVTGPDADALHDADLAILGASEARYARYAADIRKEYAWVPDAEYKTGRTAVLDSFLNRERIYRTEVMHAEGEEAAKRNMQWEVEQLEAAR